MVEIIGTPNEEALDQMIEHMFAWAARQVERAADGESETPGAAFDTESSAAAGGGSEDGDGRRSARVVDGSVDAAQT